MQLANRLNDFEESATLSMARLSRDLKEKGADVVSLTLGEPDFNTPDFVKAAAISAIENNITHYPPVSGFLELREAICRKLLRDNSLQYTPDQIVVSTGAKQSLMNTVLSIVNPGDEVILPAPYWVSYTEMVRFAGGHPIVIPTTIEENFKVNPDRLEAAISPATKAVIYSSPCNPSGAVLSAEELEAWAKVLRKYPHIAIIADEIYEHINYVGRHVSMASLEGMYDRTITVNGVSKGFAMTGWRLGYIAAPKDIAAACSKIQGQFTSGTSTISQKAAEEAMNTDPAVLSDMRKSFLDRRNLLVKLLAGIPGLKVNNPEGAFYLLPDVSAYLGKHTPDGEKIDDTHQLCMYLLSRHKVAFVGGDAFGSRDCIRLSYAASESVIKEAVLRLEVGLKSLV